MIFSRNNGIVSKPKKSNRVSLGRKDVDYNNRSALDTEENYMSLPMREKTNLDFTLQPQTLSKNELSNFESLGDPNRDFENRPKAAAKEDLLTFSSYQNTLEKENLQENVPFLLRHPANRNSLVKDSKISNKNDGIIEKIIQQQEFKIHEMSFNKDLLNSTNRTVEQETARSLKAAGPYELTEEEEQVSPSNQYEEDTFEKAISQDRLKEVRNEVMNLKQNEQQGGNMKAENRSAASENYIISLFYQIVNENKLLKQETQHLHERIDDLIKNKQSESEIIINLQQNLELTMMLMKRRDEEFLRLQKQHEELSKKFDSYVSTQASKVTYDNYIQQPSKSNSFMLYQDVDDGDELQPQHQQQQQQYHPQNATSRTSRRSSSYNNPPGPGSGAGGQNAVQRGNQNRAVDPRAISRQGSIENHQQQASHRMMFPPQNNNMFSAVDNDMMQNSFVENRRGSGYNVRAQTIQTQERHESGFDTYGDNEPGYLPLTEPNSLFFNQGNQGGNKMPQNEARRQNYMNQQQEKNTKGQRKENINTSVRLDYSREREKASDMKENNKWRPSQGQGSSNRSPNTSQSNFNGGWMGNNTPKVTPSDPINDSKVKSRGQNYKKYSDLFRKQKEMSDIGNNFLKEEIRGKIQRK